MGVEFTYGGEAEADEAKADVVDAKGQGSFAARIFLDKATHRPLMLQYRGAAPRVVMQTMRGGPPPDPAHLQAERHILPRGHMREERVGLEHHAHVALVGAEGRDVGAAKKDLAAGYLVEARDQPERGGLAAARRPEESHQLARGERQRELVERDDAGKHAAQLLQPDLDAELAAVRAHQDPSASSEGGTVATGAIGVSAGTTRPPRRRRLPANDRIISSTKANNSEATATAIDVPALTRETYWMATCRFS